MNTGEKLKLRRKTKGFTQKELAKYSLVSENAIKQYESNKRTPRIEQLTKLSGVLDCSPLDLLGDDLSPLSKWNYQYDIATLSQEVHLFDSITEFFGKDASILLGTYTSLNATGKDKVQEYIQDMLKLYEEGE